MIKAISTKYLIAKVSKGFKPNFIARYTVASSVSIYIYRRN